MKLKSLFTAGLLCCGSALAHSPEQLKPLVFESKYDFAQTINVLDSTFVEKGMTVFAHIDHTAAAKNVGLEMQPATVIIYGAPKAGTPLMVKDPSLALQLPLKVLVTETQPGKVEVMLNSAEQVVERSQTAYDDVKNSLAKAEKLIQTTVSK